MPRRYVGPLAIVLAVLALTGWAGAATKSSRVHVVHDGQSLARIAKRYDVSVDAICRANGISRAAPIKPKQKLVIPERSPGGKSETSAVAQPTKAAPTTQTPSTPRSSSKPARANPNETWSKYVRPAPRPGYVDLRGTGRSWQGYAIVKGNKISEAGARGFKRALASWRTGASEDVDPRLIRLVTETSDLFGGRPIRVVGGYRENSYAQESKHKTGRALDFEIVGVPNEALRDYLRTLKNVGVGYYPNSSFVHLDVRKKHGYWEDESRPGQPPAYRYQSPGKKPARNTIASSSQPHAH